MREKEQETISLEPGDDWPLIPEGEYEAYCYKASFGPGPKTKRRLYLNLEIQDGEYAGTKLFMACSWPEGKKPNSRFKVYKQWCLAMERRPEKGERITCKAFVKKFYRVLVRNTKRKSSNDELLPDYLQHSIVDTILSKERDYRYS
jgi:hypothetical protein